MSYLIRIYIPVIIYILFVYVDSGLLSVTVNFSTSRSKSLRSHYVKSPRLSFYAKKKAMSVESYEESDDMLMACGLMGDDIISPQPMEVAVTKVCSHWIILQTH